MAYTPTVWATGDVVTAVKLNKLENGVAESTENVGDCPVVTVIITIDDDTSTTTCNKTYAELAQMTFGEDYRPIVLIKEVERWTEDEQLNETVNCYYVRDLYPKYEPRRVALGNLSSTVDGTSLHVSWGGWYVAEDGTVDRESVSFGYVTLTPEE